MADIALLTANTVRPGTLTVKQHTFVAGAAITAGSPCYINATTGKVHPSDANVGTADAVWGIATRTVAAGEGVTLIRCGWMFGFDFSAQAFGARIYVSDTAGALADAAGTASMVVGHVLPVFGETLGSTAGKGLYIDIASGTPAENPA